MGRKKIKIKTIENDRQKTVTFTRRRGGLIKKAHELAVLCECKVVLLMFDSKDECHMYSSAENPDELIGKYYNKEFHSGDTKKRKLSVFNEDTFTPSLSQENFHSSSPVVNEYKITTTGEGSENIQVKQIKGTSTNINAVGPNGQQCITFEPITTTADDFIESTSLSMPFSNTYSSSLVDSSEDSSSCILQHQPTPPSNSSDIDHQNTPFMNIPAIESCISTESDLISRLGEQFCYKPPDSFNMPSKGDLTEFADYSGSAATSPGSESPPEMFQLYSQPDPNQPTDCLGEYTGSIPAFSKQIHLNPTQVASDNTQYSNQLDYFPNFDPNSINLWGWPSGTKTDSFNQIINHLSFKVPKEG
ncbi:hypothetical protein K7432_015941 [Basidiobolus ranarum]|uniref:MADS-box domain-containing protein n=1 Tax=Basidiobolus ranarum TaxID=34480 RepID=A0ABR2WFH2_9FUNG